jgi:serine/threonine protein kinase
MQSVGRTPQYPDGYTKSVDIWSAGVVLYALLNGNFPFKGNNIRDIKMEIISRDSTELLFQPSVSEDAINLLNVMLNKDPSKRLNVNEVLKHPWFNKADKPTKIFNQIEVDMIMNEYTYIPKICELGLDERDHDVEEIKQNLA